LFESNVRFLLLIVHLFIKQRHCFLLGKIQELEAEAKKLTQKASLNTNPLEITLTEVKKCTSIKSICKHLHLFFLVDQQVVGHGAAART
jgi:hypothetical protein